MAAVVNPFNVSAVGETEHAFMCYKKNDINKPYIELSDIPKMYATVAKVKRLQTENADSLLVQTYTPEIVPTWIKNVDDANKFIIESFLKFHRNAIYDYPVEKMHAHFETQTRSGNEFINVWMSRPLIFRRCSALVVVQESDRGVRFLFYAFDEVRHSAQCFGTGVGSFSSATALQHIRETLPEMKKMFGDKMPDFAFDEAKCFL